MQLDRLTTRADIRANMWHISNSPLGSHRLTPVPILEKWMWLDRSRARSGNLSELDGPGAYTRVNKHENVVHLVQNFHRYEKKKISKDRPCTQCCRTEWVTCSESSACVEHSQLFLVGLQRIYHLGSRIHAYIRPLHIIAFIASAIRVQWPIALLSMEQMGCVSLHHPHLGKRLAIVFNWYLPQLCQQQQTIHPVAATAGILTGHKVLTSLSQPLTTYILPH